MAERLGLSLSGAKSRVFAEVEAMLAAAGFVDIRVEPKAESRASPSGNCWHGDCKSIAETIESTAEESTMTIYFIAAIAAVTILAATFIAATLGQRLCHAEGRRATES